MNALAFQKLVNIHLESVKKPIKNGKLSIHNNEKTSASWPTVCKHKRDWPLDSDEIKCITLQLQEFFLDSIQYRSISKLICTIYTFNYFSNGLKTLITRIRLKELYFMLQCEFYHEIRLIFSKHFDIHLHLKKCILKTEFSVRYQKHGLQRGRYTNQHRNKDRKCIIRQKFKVGVCFPCINSYWIVLFVHEFI